MATLHQTLGELIAQGLGDALVVLSKDEDGNGFGELNDVDGDNNKFDAEDGEIGLDHLTPDLEKEGFGEDDVMTGGVPAIVLWP